MAALANFEMDNVRPSRSRRVASARCLDLPILSAGSLEAAKVANAFLRQFKGEKFWDAVGYGDLQAKIANMKKCGKTAC